MPRNGVWREVQNPFFPRPMAVRTLIFPVKVVAELIDFKITVGFRRGKWE